MTRAKTAKRNKARTDDQFLIYLELGGRNRENCWAVGTIEQIHQYLRSDRPRTGIDRRVLLHS